MEGDEVEMTVEELQKWIRGKVKKSELISTDVLERCNVLLSLLERREKQAAYLLKLCESVAACEAIVKKQYSLLGWDYRDSDSDEDVNTTCGNTPPSQLDPAEARAASSQTTNGCTPLLPKLGGSETLYRHNGKKISINFKRQPVVVLTRLPPWEISSLRPAAPQDHDMKDKSSDNSDSDVEWEPDDDSSDCDYSISSYNSRSNKRRKRDQRNEERARSHAKPKASRSTDSKNNATRASTPKARTDSDSKSSAAKSSTPNASRDTNMSQPAPAIISAAFSRHSDETRNIRPNLPEEEIKVDMMVLAKRKPMRWQQGKIVEIVTREDGRLKYKVSFEDKGKSLVSGHHIAFDSTPKLEQLYVGARVVVGCQEDKLWFQPGVLAELPTRRNRLRYLVFLDDHIPVYVGLPLLHLVCRPLEDVVDDIPDSRHKFFMSRYLKDWPYPHLTQYKAGQSLNVELNGVQQRCEVQVVDSSLIQVVFQENQHTEWIHRGSIRLEHMTRFLEMRREEEQKDG
ncbi:histone-lysine N-methyltransferase SETDB1-B-like [Chaetodon trifascialis]|uniref:histone-lysine N-methyltransferase SETDB1-B-like n=1 Tax=Chaetodon trifascialis TaxID=109706 RepID=UPI00399289A1